MRLSIYFRNTDPTGDRQFAFVVLTPQETVHLLSWHYWVNEHFFAGVRVANLHRVQDALGDRALFRVPWRRYHQSRWTVLISTTIVNGGF